ncbi:MAG: hypothetical protein ABW007_01790 [Chitinophagaceae bacterium]
MSIILRNDLDTLITYATNVGSGSGMVSPNGRTVTLPPEATMVYWTVEPGAIPGSFQGAQFPVQDNYVYTIAITGEPI